MSFFKKRAVATEASGGFGADLIELRELRGYSREVLGKMTGIHPATIRSFEEERIEELVDPAYGERHVRLLVAALDGYVPYFLRKYQELLMGRGIGADKPVLLQPRVRRRDLFVTSRVLGVAGVLVIVFAMGAYIAWQAFGLSVAPALTLRSPFDGARVTEPRVEVVGRTDPSAFVRVNGEQAIVDSSGDFHLMLDIPRGLITIRVEARRRYGASSFIERHIIYERPDTATSSSL
jgi:transcriptional regulator with XRE-family HTH domain